MVEAIRFSSWLQYLKLPCITYWLDVDSQYKVDLPDKISFDEEEEEEGSDLD